MLNRFLVSSLLMAMALGGCIDDGEDPGPQEASSSSSSNSFSAEYRNFTVEDGEAVLVQIDTDTGFNLTYDGEWWFGDDFIFGAFVYGDRYNLIASHNGEIEVGYNDQRIGVDDSIWSGYLLGPIDFDEPGNHTLAIYSKGRATTVNLATESGRISQLNETVAVRYYNDNHPDWEKTQIVVSPWLTYMQGDLLIEPKSEVMDVHARATYNRHGDVELKIDDQVCSEQYVNSAYSALTDQTASVNVDAAARGPYTTEVFVVDWPFDLGGHGCWTP